MLYLEYMKKYYLFLAVLVSTIAFFSLLEATQAQNNDSMSSISTSSPISFVGPRMNIPTKSPTAYGFWSFAVPVSGVISRSGQPTIDEFKWLRSKGWKSVVNLRFDNEYKEVADDMKLKGFKELGFNYLRLSIKDGAAPTDKQAKEFLAFVTNPKNQPAHIHCRGGYGRAGTMIALYRYEIQHWPMNQAIKESTLFHGGVSAAQKRWLKIWEKK